MKTEGEIRQALRDWIASKSGGKVQSPQLTDQTPIIEQRIITSVQAMDLIFFIERLREHPIDVERLKVGVFRNVDAIYANFFADGPRGG